MPLHRIRARQVGLGVAISATLWTGACEFPTAAPKWVTKWEVPAESATVVVKNFLPPGVTIGGTGQMLVSVPAPAAVSTTLGAVCGAACPATATVPVPAFNNVASPIAGFLVLPVAVSAASIASGQVDVAVTNNFSFDPIKPAGSVASGSIRIKLTSAGGVVTVADTTLTGAGVTMPSGVTTTYHILLKAVTVGAGAIAYQVTIACPGSVTPATINPANTMVVAPSIAAPGIAISGATVQLIAQAVSDSTPAFDLSGTQIDTTTIQSAALAIRITNPFMAGGSLTATLSAPGVVSVVKPLLLNAALDTISPSKATATLNYTTTEISRFIGKTGVRVKYAGTVTGTGPGSTLLVKPTQALGMQADLRASIMVGGK